MHHYLEHRMGTGFAIVYNVHHLGESARGLTAHFLTSAAALLVVVIARYDSSSRFAAEAKKCTFKPV